MWTNSSTEIIGHGGRRIYNRFYAHPRSTGGLTVIVAGYAYTVESPYLFYSKHVPFAHEDDVLTIDFEYSRHDAFLELSDQDKDVWFRAEVEGVADYVRRLDRYDRLSFIGKSLGTTVVFRLLQDSAIREKTRRAVWITPGEKRREIADLLCASPLQSLIVYGGADRYAEDAPIERLQSRSNVSVLVVPDADHALETAAGPPAAIEHLARYVRSLGELYGRENS